MKKKTRVLVVDDEELLRYCLMDWLEKDGYVVDAACNGQEALEKARNSPYDMYLVDIVMPVMDGIAFLDNIRGLDPDAPVVMMTAHGSVDSAVEAMKKGASDYLQKPFDPRQVYLRLHSVEEKRLLIEENLRCKDHIQRMTSFGELIATSRRMLEVFDLIEDVAHTDATVLITGESGTGKEMVARAIHVRSPRKESPMVAANFGALTESLAESELFGHEKGAFTGAQTRKPGLLELAHRGTLFLDEIGDASPKMQIDLLRVLQERRFLKVGGSRPVDVDVRIIAATNKDLEKEIQTGSFRHDLYYRLNVVRIHLPPLRERKEDIPALVEAFVAHFAAEMKKPVTGLFPEAHSLLLSHDWPGNIRELRNAVERAMVVAKGRRLHADDFPEFLSRRPADLEDDSLDAVERRHIRKKLGLHDWNISRTAEILGIDRTTLYAKIKKYRLSRA